MNQMILRKIFNKYDPCGLIIEENGKILNEDEYDPEISDILGYLDSTPEDKLADKIYQTFVKWFVYKKHIGGREIYDKIAAEICIKKIE